MAETNNEDKFLEMLQSLTSVTDQDVNAVKPTSLSNSSSSPPLSSSFSPPPGTRPQKTSKGKSGKSSKKIKNKNKGPNQALPDLVDTIPQTTFLY